MEQINQNIFLKDKRFKRLGKRLEESRLQEKYDGTAYACHISESGENCCAICNFNTFSSEEGIRTPTI